jgi:hypothetical protein
MERRLTAQSHDIASNEIKVTLEYGRGSMRNLNGMVAISMYVLITCQGGVTIMIERVIARLLTVLGDGRND